MKRPTLDGRFADPTTAGVAPRGMPDPTNAQIAAALDELGDLYELDGAIVHRVVAYREGARAVRDASVSVAGLAREGRAIELPAIGKTLQEKIVTLMETGDIPSAQRLREKFPAGLVDIVHAVPGMGPKRVRALYDGLGIDSIEALEAATATHEVRKLKGFGAKAEETIAAALAAAAERGPEGQRRTILSRALAIGEPIAAALRDHPAADRVELAGSARRLADSVKDLDLIATANDPLALARALHEIPAVQSVGTVGEAGARGVTHTGLKIDLKIVAPDQFGNLLQHFTGSKAHNMQLREAAVRRGLHVSEYGVLDDETGETLRCPTEEAVYERLGYAWIPPELREGRGELEASARGALPDLIDTADIRGDLHSHTTASDGRQTLDQMAEEAQRRGWEYLAVTDHSASHGFGDHVTPEMLEARIEEIAALN